MARPAGFLPLRPEKGAFLSGAAAGPHVPGALARPGARG